MGSGEELTRCLTEFVDLRLKGSKSDLRRSGQIPFTHGTLVGEMEKDIVCFHGRGTQLLESEDQIDPVMQVLTD